MVYYESGSYVVSVFFKKKIYLPVPLTVFVVVNKHALAE